MNELISRVEEYVFGGQAVFTLESQKTMKHFTYRVKQDKGRYFVSVLRGEDNERDYRYVGMLNQATLQLHLTQKSSYSSDATCVKAFEFFLRHLHNIPATLKVYHSGRCACCGRLLTTPDSIESGFGPKCAKKFGVSALR